jgi:hypothetical protein
VIDNENESGIKVGEIFEEHKWYEQIQDEYERNYDEFWKKYSKVKIPKDEDSEIFSEELNDENVINTQYSDSSSQHSENLEFKIFGLFKKAEKLYKKSQSKGNNQKVYLEEELNLENLFEEPDNMATAADVNRELERALGLQQMN